MKEQKTILVRSTPEIPRSLETQETDEESRPLILKENPTPKVSGEIALRLISSRFYVHEKTKVTDLLHDLQHHPYIPACGVVDDDMTVKGIIIRERFLSAMTQPYMLDVYRHRNVESLVQSARSYFYQIHIYSLAEELSDHMESREEEFFILKDEKERFIGIFSTRDLLIYLSRIMQKDIRAARDVQKNLVPEELVYNRPLFSLFGASHAAKEVGGDFYAWKTLPDGIVLLLCDVAGKGPSASLITTSLSGMFQAFDFERKKIGEFLHLLNNYLFAAFHGEKYLTGAFAVLHEKSGVCHVWDMGHGHIAIRRRHSIYKVEMEENNVPLGLFDYINPKPSRIQLHRDDMLLFFSDGIVEQKNPSGEFYGEKRLYRILKGSTNPQLIREAIWKDLKNFRGRYPQGDDVSFLLLHYHPGEGEYVYQNDA
ncbi:MAG: SpoIIE family protein phosphatase [Brevinematales bacterium]|nr:SpoIIE family protein phosphatase [Brevinematales bacterium]